MRLMSLVLYLGHYQVIPGTECLITVEKSTVSIFAGMFIYFAICFPNLTHERVHFTRLQLCPCSTQALPARCFREQASSDESGPAVLGLIPATQETTLKARTRSENCLPHQLQLVSSFPALLTPVPCPLWSQSCGLSLNGPIASLKLRAVFRPQLQNGS